MKKYLYAAAALLLLFGCEKNPGIEPVVKPDKISITPENVTFEYEGGAQQVIVTSTGEWTLTAAESYDWISASRTSGKDGDIVTFTATANATDAQRAAEYVFKSGEAETKFTAIINCGELSYLTLTSEADVEIPFTAGRVEVVVNSNLNYRSLATVVSGDAAEWLSFYVAIDADNHVAKLYYNVKENEARDNREATITISGEGVESVSVNLIQRAEPIIIPEKSQYVLYPEGGSVAIPVDSNIEYEVSVEAAEGAAWLKYDGKKSDGETFSAAAFTGKRYATIFFTEKNPISGMEPLVVSVAVRQTPPPIVTRAIDMTGNRAWPEWANNNDMNNLSAFTLEGLFCADDFKTNGSLSTLFGIEGNFLVRIGDAGIPSNRLQLATGSGNFTNATAEFETGRWYHVAVTYDNGAIVAYIDGEVAFSGNYTGWNKAISLGAAHSNESGYSVTRCFWFGYAYDGNRDLRGRMAEIRVWKKALTAEEINAEDHFYKVDPKSEGLYAYWSFNDAEGGVVEDLTGNGCKFHGELDVHEGRSGYYTEWQGTEGIRYVDVSLPE